MVLIELYSTESMLKNIGKCKRKLNKETFPYFVNACWRKRKYSWKSVNLFMQIHFINQLVLVQLYCTKLMLKNIEKCKKIQTKKRVHISWVHVYKNASNIFDKVLIYLWKFPSSIKWFWFNSTVLNWRLKWLKNIK